ncbi:hypothetical protein NJB1604_08790 [Mycobacterium marinum]|nr:hypothetical protein NJB1604_08790 [Mycobacterium marinum]
MEKFELYQGESAECALVAVSVVGALDRGHDHQAVLGSGVPASPVEHVALQKGGGPLHCGVVPPWTGVLLTTVENQARGDGEK